MIYLITGAPGTGKTAAALALLQTLPQYPDKVVVIGVRQYKGGGVYHETLPEEFDFAAYPGVCFLIDEAQDYWPSRVAGYKAPASLEFLPKHRHIGQDFILTCQFATQLDVKLRQIVGRHIHLEKEPLGVFQYEAGRCVERVADFPPHSKRPRPGISQQTKDIYVSMEGEETVLQKSRPPLPLKLFLVLGLAGVLFSGAVLWWYNSDSLISPKKDNKEASSGNTITDAILGKGSSGTAAPGQKADILPLREIKHPLELGPGNTDYPELAEQPRLPVSCVATRTRCECWDQALQRIDGIARARCMKLVQGRDEMVSSWARDDTPRRPPFPAELKKNQVDQKSSKSGGEPDRSQSPL